MKGGKKVIPKKAFSGKSEKIHSEGKKKDIDELLHPKTDFESLCMHGEAHAWGMGSGLQSFEFE